MNSYYFSGVIDKDSKIVYVPAHVDDNGNHFEQFVKFKVLGNHEYDPTGERNDNAPKEVMEFTCHGKMADELCFIAKPGLSITLLYDKDDNSVTDILYHDDYEAESCYGDAGSGEGRTVMKALMLKGWTGSDFIGFAKVELPNIYKNEQS